jgi:hypothetical protein
LQVLLLPQATGSKKLPNEIWLSLFLPMKVEESGLNPLLLKEFASFYLWRATCLRKVAQGLHPLFHPSMKKKWKFGKRIKLLTFGLKAWEEGFNHFNKIFFPWNEGAKKIVQMLIIIWIQSK